MAFYVRKHIIKGVSAEYGPFASRGKAETEQEKIPNSEIIEKSGDKTNGDEICDEALRDEIRNPD